MLRIRLTRVGKKNSPAYRVVVADQRKAVKRKFIEILGHYNPIMNPKQLVIDKERALFWMGLGAQPTNTVNNLMVDLGVLAKDKKINKVYGKKVAKKDEGKAPTTEGVGIPTDSVGESEEKPAEETAAPVEATEDVPEEKAPEVAEETVAEEPVAETNAEEDKPADTEEDNASTEETPAK